jgi:plastocyanin
MAAGCSSYQTSPVTTAPTTSTAGGNTIVIKNFAFDPSSLTVKSGTAVKWTNQDGASHAIVSDTGSPATFSSDSLSTGASYSFTFTQPGTYTYHCSIHPSMKGTIIVTS